MASTASNRAIKIEDLQEKFNVEEENLIIVEDELDTKKTTVKELKKSFSGDYIDPSKNYFYSSQKIHDLINTVNIAISGKAPLEYVKELKQRIEDIIKETELDPSKDSEIVEARNGHDTLSDRLFNERDLSNALYMKKSFKTIQGSIVNIDGHVGLLDVTPVPSSSFVSTAQGKIIYYSKNRLNLSSIIYNENESSLSTISHGFKYTQLESEKKTSIDLLLDKVCAAGKYYLISQTEFSTNFTDKEIILKVTYKDGSNDSFIYDHSNYFQFEARNSFDKISLVYSNEKFANNEYVQFSDLMLSQYKLSEYVAYDYNESELIDYNETYAIYNDDYIFEYSIPNSNLIIEYYDQSVTIDTILQEIQSLSSIINDKIEKCGLMENYGTYHPFESCELISSDTTGEISDSGIEYERNGFVSKKVSISYNESEDLAVKQILTDLPEPLESVSLCFYIDKTVLENFTDGTGLTVILCSDDPSYSNINYFKTTITRSEMIHGWNVVKRQLSEFETVHSPNIYAIKSVSVVVAKDEDLHGKEFYLNCVCFNQKIKPTVIISFDGTYENSAKNVYPYLTMRNIPASVLLNDSRTISAEEFNELIKLRITKGWDIGSYGCNPNKELLLKDDNFRNQYMGLYKNKQFIQDNAIANPISYSAPYGDLRPITVPILKDLGYKIARTESNSYISIFTEKDFAIPMTLISNLITEDEIIAKIDYAIANNVAISLFTRDVTEYGDEASAKMAMFESIINYIYEKVQSGELQCLTMAEFYNKCTE